MKSPNKNPLQENISFDDQNHFPLIKKSMSVFNYLLVAALLIVWLLGYIVFNFGPMIHVLFLLALIIMIFTLYKENKKS